MPLATPMVVAPSQPASHGRQTERLRSAPRRRIPLAPVSCACTTGATRQRVVVPTTRQGGSDHPGGCVRARATGLAWDSKETASDRTPRRLPVRERRTAEHRASAGRARRCMLTEILVAVAIATVFLAPALFRPTPGRVVLSMLFVGGGLFNLLYTLPNAPGSLVALVA